jgi:hypothetical protein
MKLLISKTARKSAKDYVPALLEACAKGGGADPVAVLEETASYPKVVKHIDMAEFLVGFFHGLADQLEVDVGAVWRELAGDRPAPAKAAPAGKGKARRRDVETIVATPGQVAAWKAADEPALCGVRPAPSADPCFHPAGHVQAGQRIHSNGGMTWSDRKAKPRAVAPNPLAIPPEGYPSREVGAVIGRRRAKATTPDPRVRASRAGAAPAITPAELATRPPAEVVQHPDPLVRELAISIATAAPTTPPRRRKRKATTAQYSLAIDG